MNVPAVSSLVLNLVQRKLFPLFCRNENYNTLVKKGEPMIKIKLLRTFLRERNEQVMRMN